MVEAIDHNLDAVAAGIVVVGGVERLMHVSDQMQQELQRDEAFLRIGPGRLQFRGEVLNLSTTQAFLSPTDAREMGRTKNRTSAQHCARRCRLLRCENSVPRSDAGQRLTRDQPAIGGAWPGCRQARLKEICEVMSICRRDLRR
jgi:hypothetical protein